MSYATGQRTTTCPMQLKNVWSNLHPLKPCEVPVDLGDYSKVASNENVISTLKEGLYEAQKMIRVLRMAPNNLARGWT
jgi:hypothetical protein